MNSIRLSKSAAELVQSFSSLSTRQDVAELLEVDYERLNYHINFSNPDNRYSVIEIPKKSGGMRRISIPVSALKIIQRKLNQVLKEVYKPRARIVHSFIHDRSIKSNALRHLNRRWVLNIDLEDFFPSINFGRVRGLFMANPYGLNREVATVLAQICCHDNELPQGAPTSPIISNLITYKLDNELLTLSRSNSCRYSRYADDLTFSTNERQFPSAIADSSQQQTQIGNDLVRIINDNGFNINNSKIRLRKNNVSQRVTGVIVNNTRPNVDRGFVRQIRAMLHNWEKFGLESANAEYQSKFTNANRPNFKGIPTLKQVIRGKLAFLRMIVSDDSPVYQRYESQYERLYMLDKYYEMSTMDNFQRRGYLLQDLLNDMLRYYKIDAFPSFKRASSGEQIDGGFRLSGQHYLAECRWRRQPASLADILAFWAKVYGSGGFTMGLFLSINGWSDNAVEILKQRTPKSIILNER